MALLLPAGNTDVAGQVAIVQGVDSNVFQSQDANGAITRYPAAFTSLEGSLAVSHAGRVSGDTSDLRLFGRFLNYEPLGPTFESRAARGGLSYQGASRLDRRTALVVTLLGSVGSLNADRGSDLATNVIDPVSTRRNVWLGAGALSFIAELSPVTTFRALAGLDASGTINETVPATGESLHRGLDYLVGRSRLSLVHRIDVRTSVEGALLVERMHTAYVLAGANPAAPSAGPLDGAAATATFGVSRALGRQTLGNAALGVAFAIPQFGEKASALPVASAGLIRAEDRWSLSALASLQYALAQPRVGPGPSASFSLVLIGKPIASRDLFDVIAEASGQRTGISTSVNDGSTTTSGGGSITLRWGITRAIGFLVGYDFRVAHFEGSASLGSSPWYVRHLGFVGLSFGWLGSGALSTLPTLARPAVMPFTATP